MRMFPREQKSPPRKNKSANNYAQVIVPCGNMQPGVGSCINLLGSRQYEEWYFGLRFILSNVKKLSNLSYTTKHSR